MSRPSTRRRPQPCAYGELGAPAVEARPFDHLIIKREDSPLEAAQRHLIEISLESYQSATKPERSAEILIELRRATTVTDEDFASVARYALQNAETNLRYMARYKPQAEVVVLQQQRPDPDQSIKDGQAMRQQPQL